MARSPQNKDTPGGTGDTAPEPTKELATKDRRYQRGELRLLERAAKERWPVKESDRALVVSEMRAVLKRRTTEVIDSQGKKVKLSNARSQAIAARVLKDLERQNQTDEHLLFETMGAPLVRDEENDSTVTPIFQINIMLADGQQTQHHTTARKLVDPAAPPRPPSSHPA